MKHPLPEPWAEDLFLARVYVWQVPVRICHWLIFASIAVLSVTGFYLGSPFLSEPGEAGRHFATGTMRAIHFYAAIVFALAVVTRLVWMFRGNRYARWDKFLPVDRKRWRGLGPTLKFYLFAMRKPPGFIGHNPLAGIVYAGVFGMYLVQIATGLAIYGASAHVGSPTRPFAALLPLLGGLATARFVHHAIMWGIWGFAAHHVYSAVAMSQIEQNATIESIFSGYKFVPHEDLVYSGYRFREREIPHAGTPS
jgi:Ni/Fe-hydrogenase 1 B-type cytochrome subunit